MKIRVLTLQKGRYSLESERTFPNRTEAQLEINRVFSGHDLSSWDNRIAPPIVEVYPNDEDQAPYHEKLIVFEKHTYQREYKENSPVQFLIHGERKIKRCKIDGPYRSEFLGPASTDFLIKGGR